MQTTDRKLHIVPATSFLTIYLFGSLMVHDFGDGEPVVSEDRNMGEYREELNKSFAEWLATAYDTIHVTI